MIAGVAQFCDECEARQHAPVEGPPPNQKPQRPAAAPTRQTSHQLDLAVFAIIGGVVFAGVCLFALGGAGLIGIGGDDSTGGDRSGPVTRTFPPSTAPLGFEEGECTFEAPDGVEASCGYLTVPQVRAKPDQGTVTLPVAVFKATGAGRRPDPVVYLDGGPGGNTLKQMPGIYEVMKPLAVDRDLVLFDQRGAGGSTPSLDCPEVTQVNYDLLQREFTVDERVAHDAASVQQCHERLLSEGINPALATSAESAADVDELREALGYEQWNLYGVSYGTRLALTVMRDFPAGVRSVILDSTYPPQSDVYAETPADFSRSLNLVFDRCAADAACSAAYPDLRQAFGDTVLRLNERPVIVSLTVGGRSIEGAVIDGVWFSAFIFQSLYSEALIPLLPRAIFDSRDGAYDVLTILANVYLQNAEFISPGMYLSVQCAEESPFSDREATLAAAVRADPVLKDYNEYSVKSIFASCDIWEAPAAAAKENEAVASPIPTLVLAGEFDPITPPAWGRLVAEGLENSFFFEFPGLAHGVALSGDCPLGVATAFLDAPQQQPATGCVDLMAGPEWAVE